MDEKQLHTFSLAFALLATVLTFNILPHFLNKSGLDRIYSGAAAVTSIVSGVRVEMAQSAADRTLLSEKKEPQSVTLHVTKNTDDNTVTFDWKLVNKSDNVTYETNWVYCGSGKNDQSLVARLPGSVTTYTMQLPAGDESCYVRVIQYKKNRMSSSVIRSKAQLIKGSGFSPLEVKKKSVTGE